MSPKEQAMGLIASLGLALVAEQWRPLVGALWLALLLHPWLSWRYSTSHGQQRKLMAWVGLPVILLSLLRLASSRQPMEASFGLAILGTIYLQACAVAEVYRQPEQARPEVFHMGMLTVMLVGGLRSQNLLYPLLLVGYFLLGVALLRHPFGGWWKRQPLPARPVPLRGILLAIGLTLALAVPARFLVPEASRVLYRLYVGRFFSNPLGGQSHLFGPSSDLRSVLRLGGSRTVVLRCWGPSTYLRGQVYTQYHAGRWTAPVLKERRREIKPDDLGGATRPPLGPPSPLDLGRYFTLPGPVPAHLDHWTLAPVQDISGTILAPTGAYRVQGFPDLRIDSYDKLLGDTIEPYQIWADQQCHERSPSCLSPRDPEYLQCPPELAQALLDWSKPWVQAHPALDLTLHLSQKGRYRIHEGRGRGKDPIQGFLAGGLSGHCELFASTLVLSLRARGIPARYVVGFQVYERNPWGDYFIVRERDAHAWVEAYVEGRWQSFDPTPAEQQRASHPEGDSPNPWTGISDWCNSRWAKGLSWLRQAEIPGGLLLALTLSPLLWLASRRSPSPAGSVPAHPLLLRLSQRLRRLGLDRQPQETLEEWSQRLLAELDNEAGQACSRWLADYAALRYGGRPTDLEAGLAQLPALRPRKREHGLEGKV